MARDAGTGMVLRPRDYGPEVFAPSMIAIPSVEALYTLYLGTLDTEGPCCITRHLRILGRAFNTCRRCPGSTSEETRGGAGASLKTCDSHLMDQLRMDSR